MTASVEEVLDSHPRKFLCAKSAKANTPTYQQCYLPAHDGAIHNDIEPDVAFFRPQAENGLLDWAPNFDCGDSGTFYPDGVAEEERVAAMVGLGIRRRVAFP